METILLTDLEERLAADDGTLRASLRHDLQAALDRIARRRTEFRTREGQERHLAATRALEAGLAILDRIQLGSTAHLN